MARAGPREEGERCVARDVRGDHCVEAVAPSLQGQDSLIGGGGSTRDENSKYCRTSGHNQHDQGGGVHLVGDSLVWSVVIR